MNDLKNVIKNIKKKKEETFFKKFENLVSYFFDKFTKHNWSIKINNPEEIKTEIDLSSIKFPRSFSVDNLGEIAEYIVIPKNKDFPKSIEVSNLAELAKFIEIKEKVEIPDEFYIKNLKDIPKVEFPENFKNISLKKTEELLESLAKELILQRTEETNDVFILNKKPEEYIPVRIVDKKGVDWLDSFGQSFMSFPSKMGLRNKKLEDIDPATETKQDSEIVLLGDIKTAIGGSLKEYITQVIDDYTTTSVTYFCKMKSDGTWLFQKIDETGNFPTFTYANVSNNPTLTTYALAYAARTTATYNLLNVLTI